MIEIEYKNHKILLVTIKKLKETDPSKRVVIENANGLKVVSYISLGDTDWHIDRAKFIIDGLNQT